MSASLVGLQAVLEVGGLPEPSNLSVNLLGGAQNLRVNLLGDGLHCTRHLSVDLLFDRLLRTRHLSVDLLFDRLLRPRDLDVDHTYDACHALLELLKLAVVVGSGAYQGYEDREESGR